MRDISWLDDTPEAAPRGERPRLVALARDDRDARRVARQTVHDVDVILVVGLGAAAPRALGEPCNDRMALGREREQRVGVAVLGGGQRRELDRALAVGRPVARLVVLPRTDEAARQTHGPAAR